MALETSGDDRSTDRKPLGLTMKLSPNIGNVNVSLAGTDLTVTFTTDIQNDMNSYTVVIVTKAAPGASFITLDKQNATPVAPNQNPTRFTATINNFAVPARRTKYMLQICSVDFQSGTSTPEAGVDVKYQSPVVVS